MFTHIFIENDCKVVFGHIFFSHLLKEEFKKNLNPADSMISFCFILNFLFNNKIRDRIRFAVLCVLFFIGDWDCCIVVAETFNEEEYMLDHNEHIWRQFCFLFRALNKLLAGLFN